jgi:hypothetical protein
VLDTQSYYSRIRSEQTCWPRSLSMASTESIYEWRRRTDKNTLHVRSAIKDVDHRIPGSNRNFSTTYGIIAALLQRCVRRITNVVTCRCRALPARDITPQSHGIRTWSPMQGISTANVSTFLRLRRDFFDSEAVRIACRRLGGMR